MLNEIWVNDEQLDVSDIRQLESADEIAHFWVKTYGKASMHKNTLISSVANGMNVREN